MTERATQKHKVFNTRNGMANLRVRWNKDETIVNHAKIVAREMKASTAFRKAPLDGFLL